MLFQCQASAVSLFDITSNVTFDACTIQSPLQNGIYYSPLVDGTTVVPDHSSLLSTFRFCDVENVLHILPGEEYKFFSYGAQPRVGCRRIFETLPGYSIVMFMKATTSSYSWVKTADFFEGDTVDIKNHIKLFQVIRADRGRQVRLLTNDSVMFIKQQAFIKYTEQNDKFA